MTPLTFRDDEPRVTTSCSTCLAILEAPVSLFNARSSVCCFDVGVDGCWLRWKLMSANG